MTPTLRGSTAANGVWTTAPITPTVQSVSKKSLYLAALLILVICWAHGGESGIIATLILGGIYLVSLRLSPRQRHGRCNGTGEHKGHLFSHAHHRCSGCRSGRIIRAGAYLFGARHIRDEAAAGRRERMRALRTGTWR